MAKKKKQPASSEGYSEVAQGDASPPPNALDAVQAWLQAQGGIAESSKLRIRQQEGGERAVVAEADLKKGDVLYTIPKSLWFTAAGLASHEAGNAALSWKASGSFAEAGISEEHAELCLLALLVLLERAAARSTWAAYVAALPWEQASQLPLVWQPERLASELGGAAPQRQIEEKRQQLMKVHTSIRTWLTVHLTGSSLEAFETACPSADDFLRAFALVHSRAMGISSKDAGGRSWSLAMLPFADMFNHCSEPEVDWDVVKQEGQLCVMGRSTCSVATGTELHIRYQGAASAQAFFATYGFIEADLVAKPLQLNFGPWQGQGAGPTVNVSSAQSLRQLLSRFRVEAACEEERSRLHTAPGNPGDEDLARLPLSASCEKAALERLMAEVQERLTHCRSGSSSSPAAARLRDADAEGWARLERLAASALSALDEVAGKVSAAKLAVLVHKAMVPVTKPLRSASLCTAASATFVSQKLAVRDEGGDKGRGFFATKNISAGELLLREAPAALNAAEDDFVALAAVHVMAATEEGSELRPAPGEGKVVSEIVVKALQWLHGIEGMTKERCARAYAAAENNGFRTTFPDAPDEDAMLLFFKLCIFNHSCWPNCVVHRDESTGMAHVFAGQAVQKGAELTIHYDDELLLLPKDLRRSFLKGRFGFDCECDRCEEDEDANAALKVELALQLHAPGRSDTWQEESRLGHEMKMAHASIAVMQKSDGKPAGLVHRQFDSWAEALAAVDAAMPSITAYGGQTHWARHHARGLRCLALEELRRDSAAYLALAEHLDAARQLLPRYCQGLCDLKERMEMIRARLPEALRPRLDEKVTAQYGKGLHQLSADVSKLKGWLEEAGANSSKSADRIEE